MKYFLTILLFIIFLNSLTARNLTGSFKHNAHESITLFGYAGFETIALSSTKLDSLGNFSMDYPDEYSGIGFIETSNKNNLFLILNETNISIKGTSFKETDKIKFGNSQENDIFREYAITHKQRESALAAWKYLKQMYQEVDLFKIEKDAILSIEKEIHRIDNEDAKYLKNLDKSKFVYWYIPLRKFLDDMPLSVQRYKERIPNDIAYFRKIEFANTKMQYSGIFDDLLESHYLLIENMGQPLDAISKEMNISTDYIIQNLQSDNKLLNMTVKFLFNYFEKRSLFNASEHLALSMLTHKSCILESDLSKRLEAYRLMNKGNTAPDIQFTNGDIFQNGMDLTAPKSMAEIKVNYMLIIFGASWCPKCNEEISQILPLYEKWKSKGIEVVFVSLDTVSVIYKSYVKNFPFVSICDYKKWDTQATKDYYVFATPTMFMLDSSRKILFRPITIDQVKSWVDSIN